MRSWKASLTNSPGERLIALSSQACVLAQERDGLKRELDSLNIKLSSLSDYEVIVTQATNLLKEVAEICEKSSKELIEKIIDHGLKVIFDEPERFGIRTETKSRAVYAFMCLGDKKTNIIDCRGGGYVDVISVLTVLTLILQQKSSMQRFLVLDESFAEVGRDHLEKVGKFLQFLTERLGMTILLITHSAELVEYAHTVYEMSLENGRTKVKRRKGAMER